MSKDGTDQGLLTETGALYHRSDHVTRVIQDGNLTWVLISLV